MLVKSMAYTIFCNGVMDAKLSWARLGGTSGGVSGGIWIGSSSGEGIGLCDGGGMPGGSFGCGVPGGVGGGAGFGLGLSGVGSDEAEGAPAKGLGSRTELLPDDYVPRERALRLDEQG